MGIIAGLGCHTDRVVRPSLRGPERAVWRAFPRGDVVDLRGRADRTVRASVLRTLLLGAQQAEPGHFATLNLIGARIVEILDLSNTDVPHLVRLRDCQFDERPDLHSARTQQIDLAGSTFPGLRCSGAIIDGTLRLTGCRSTAEIRLVGARVAGTLLLNAARFEGTESALNATRLTVGNDILGQKGLICRGEVCLSHAEIGGSVRFDGAHLSNPGGSALSAPDIVVSAVMNCCEGFRAEGMVELSYASIGSHLSFEQATLSNPTGTALACKHLDARELVLLTATPIDGEVDLRHARLGLLRDDPATWPDTLRLDGLTYDALTDIHGVDRLRWLRRDPPGYLPQTYEQLAAAYRRQGREGDARAVLLARHRRRRESLPPALRAWGYLQDLTVGYGYLPTRAAAWLVALLVAGGVTFGLHHPQVVAGSNPPGFNSVIYTLDLLIPVIDFGQQNAFDPHGALAWLAYGLIAAGWILATTIAAGISRTLGPN